MSTLQMLRYAARSLRRTPAFTTTAAVTLGIGIGAAVAIFAVLNGVLLRPLPYGNPDRLVGAWFDLPPLSLRHTQQTPGTYFTFQRFARTITGIGVYQDGAVNVAAPAGGGEPQRVGVCWVSATLLPVLQVPPLLGRTFTEAEDRPHAPDVVVIGADFWRSHFGGDPHVLGRTLEVNGVARQIIGVMPASFHFPNAITQLWLPLQLQPGDGGGFSYNAIARLAPGITVEQARRDFAAVLPRVVEITPTLAPGVSMQMVLDQAKPSPVLVPLRHDVTGDIAGTLWMVAAAAVLLLLTACANVALLVLVRADGRQRETALREALGAGRARVVMHFLFESAVITAIAAVIGLGIATLGVRAFVAAAPPEVPRLAEVSVNWLVVAFTIVIASLAAVLCSVLPALRIGHVALADALREGGRGGTSGRAQLRARDALVTAQIALALVVLAGSGLLLRTFQRLQGVQPGFQADNVATFWLSLPRARYADDSSVARFYGGLTTRVGELPGVRAVGLTSRLPLEEHGMNQNPFYAEDDPTTATKIPPLQIYSTVDGGYFRAMGIPLLAGRTFDPLDRQRAGEAIVSRHTAERFWHDSTGGRAIGKRFRELPSSAWYTVVGVVGDVRDTALAAPPPGKVYVPEVPGRDTLLEGTARTMALVVRTAGDPLAVTKTVESAIHELDPTLPTFEVRSMRQVIGGSVARLSFVIILLGAAAAVTLVLGAIGLYGVMAYLVTLRTRELGVRIALGAEPGAVAAMMTKRGLVLAGAGVLAGLALFALVARFLRSFLFGVAPGDPLTLAAAAALLIGIAALASWIPARRAAHIDPADALRAE